MRKRVLPMLILSIGCLVAASGGALHWLYESQIDQIRAIHLRQTRVAPSTSQATTSPTASIEPSSDASNLMNEISITQAHTRRALWLILSASIAVGAALAAFLYEMTGAAEQALARRAGELEQANETSARRDEALRTCSTELSGAVVAIEQRDQALRSRSRELADAQTELVDARARLHDSKVALAEARSAMEQRDGEACALSQKTEALSQELANARATLEQRVAQRTRELSDDASRRESDAEALRAGEAGLRAAVESSRQSERFARSIVDALREHLAILDSSGRILATNRAWSDFIAANGGDSRECGVGANYLAVCDAAAIMDGNEEAHAIAAGLRAVISARTDDFAAEYSCHSPHQQRWFEMRVVRFGEEGAVRLLVSHQDITSRRLAEHLPHCATGRR